MKDFILKLDKDRELRFGFKAMRTIRQKFGDRTLDQLMNIKIDEIPVLVWVGLKHEDNKLTVEQVETLLDEVIPKTYTILKIADIVLEALAAQMGVDTKKVTAGDQVAEAEKPEEATEKKKQPTKTIPSSKKQKKQP